MVNFCAVFGCSNRSNREKDKSYFRIPAIVTRSNAKKRALSIERRATWLSRIRREDLGADPSVFHRVCGDHFISGLYKCTLYHKSRGIMIGFGDFELYSLSSRFHTLQFYAHD